MTDERAEEVAENVQSAFWTLIDVAKKDDDLNGFTQDGVDDLCRAIESNTLVIDYCQFEDSDLDFTEGDPNFDIESVKEDNAITFQFRNGETDRIYAICVAIDTPECEDVDLRFNWFI